MYANATEAIEGLRHKRTGAVLPTKNVARNTKLVYFADELVGLQLHDTVIAMYREDDVVLDTRESAERPGGRHGNGWFTNVTFDRIAEFTPARPFKRSGLTFISDPAAGGARLYAHGCRITRNGSCVNDIPEPVERHIERLVADWPRKCKRHARRVVQRWNDEWSAPLPCCTEDDTDAHMIGHMEAGEPAIPWFLDNYAATARQQGLVGEAMIAELRASAETHFRSKLPQAIQLAAPNFPYPQATPRRR